MNGSKFTPGPWAVTDTCSDYSFVVVRRGQGLPDFNVGNEADARLIAAAPDLLEALIGLLRHAETETCQHDETSRGGAIWEICNQCGAKWADDRGGRPDFVWPKEIEAARAAIAKATGEEE